MTAEEIILRMNQLLPTADDLLPIVEKQTMDRLEKSETVGKKPMAPLKKKTIEFKEKKGYANPSKPWYGTGKLVSSFKFMKVGKNVVVTNTQDYFKQVEGARPVVGVDEETIRMLEEAVKARRNK